MYVDNISKRAYELFSTTFRARARQKLKNVGRGIFTGKLIDSFEFEFEEDVDEITVNILSEDYLDFVCLNSE